MRQNNTVTIFVGDRILVDHTNVSLIPDWSTTNMKRLELILYEDRPTLLMRKWEFYLHPVAIGDGGAEYWDGNPVLLRKNHNHIMDRYHWKTDPTKPYSLRTGLNVTHQVHIGVIEPQYLKGWNPDKITTVGTMPDYLNTALNGLTDCDVVRIK